MGVSLVQQEKETLSFNWFFAKEVNGTFVEYSYAESFPTVRVEQVYVKMDPIGFVFLFFFAIVMIIQVIGMLFHRWETISHIISDTRLPWLIGKDTVDDDQFEFADEENQGSVRRRSSVHPSDILAVTGVLMKEGTLGVSKGRNGSITSNESIDSLTKANTEANMFSGRRRTIKDMKKNFTKNKGEG